MLKGLPASGKSTWAKKMVDDNPGKFKRVNKDDLRAMLDNGRWSKSNEAFILAVRDTIIEGALMRGYDVIVDDTNLDPKHEEAMKAIGKKLKGVCDEEIFLEIKTFDMNVDECIARDLKRPQPVGEKVIRRMYEQYLKPEPEPIKYTPGLSNAIICDIDGTLAHMVNRGPYEWDKVDSDVLDQVVADIVRTYVALGYYILLVSGRDGSCEMKTRKWFMQNGILYDFLYMRPAGNTEKDSIIKRQIFDEYIRGKYNVAFVLDDRNQVVEMWRSLGLKCLQVADGNF